MTKANLVKIVKGIMQRGEVAGFHMMNALPDSVAKLKREGVPLLPRQMLRTVIADIDEQRYLGVLLDGKDDSIWALWKLKPKVNRFGGPLLTAQQWLGWVSAKDAYGH